MEGSFKDKSKSAPVKQVDCLVAPANPSVNINKGVRKSDKSDKKSSCKTISSKSFRGSVARHGTKEEKNVNVNRDDFLKATMRIFLVVSPPVGKMQVNICVTYFH